MSKRLAMPVVIPALYARLSAGLTIPVQNSADENQAGAFVLIGAGKEESADTKTSFGAECTIPMDIWGDPNDDGVQPVLDIYQSLASLLGSLLEVSGFEVLQQLFEPSENPVLEEGGRWHGTLELYMLLDQTS